LVSFSLAGVHPETQFRPTKSKAEAVVWEALKKRLPAGWSAWHSLKLRDRQASFGEGDFVLAHPERGILILEVKGGQLEVCDGHWFQNGRPLREAPLDQAHGFRNLLLARFRAKGMLAPSIGQAPCFPDTMADNQPGQDDLRDLVVTGHHLMWLEQALPVLAARAIPPARRASPGWLEALHDMWGETWVPTLSLGGLAKEAAARRLELDATQVEVLEGLLENDRALIEGGAGSGKTLLAAEAARRMAAAGKAVLLLCFTAPLRSWLALRLQGTGVDVQTISGFAKRLEVESGVGPANEAVGEQEGWKHAFKVAAETCTQLWDAIVVDEAQDLEEPAWRLLESLAKDRRLWAFFDLDQAFWEDRKPERALFQAFYKLPTQQRCPPGVQALAHRALGVSADDRALAKALGEGVVGALCLPPKGSTAEVAGQEVDRLLASGLEPGQIGIVSLRGQRGQEAEATHRFGSLEAVRADAPDASIRLVEDTFLRWKGLERPAIIVTGLFEEELRRAHIRLNVAITRATVAVRLVGPEAALARLGLTGQRAASSS
jgi:hypothetical protein